jgi:hypothetical protein
VIRAYDSLVAQPQPQYEIPQTRAEALRLAAGLADTSPLLPLKHARFPWLFGYWRRVLRAGDGDARDDRFSKRIDMEGDQHALELIDLQFFDLPASEFENLLIV